MQPVTFGRWLKQLRAQQDLTQEALAELVGCSPVTLRSFEIGKRRPSREMAERIAGVLNVPADQAGEFVRLARLPIERAPARRTGEHKTDAPHPAQHPAGDPSPALPQPATTLIGRAAEQAALQALLLDGRHRLLTIVGMGGMGKTRLALDLAARLRPHFGGEVFFVALAALQNARHLAATLADALGVSLQGVADPRRQLLAQLAGRKLLLVLDNFEHLLADGESVALVRAIIETAPGVQLLVTARERLRINGERIFALGGLSLPGADHPPERSDAVLLFLQRAQQAAGDFVLDPHNREAITRICRLVGGMPLGLELAAAWVRTLSCDEIASEIARTVDILARADRDAPPRHRSMRAVFEHSWRLLDETEQDALMALAYFLGGCTRQAAEEAAGATLPVLASLVDKSLLTRSAEGRYLLHELIGQCAHDHLRRRPERLDEVRRRHAAYFAAFLRHNHPRLESAQQPAAIGEITAELENLRLAWDWICATRRVDLAQPFVLAFGYYLDIRGRYQEGERFMDQGVQAFGQLPAAEDGAYGASAALLALLYSARGYSRARLLQPDAARQDLQQGLQWAHHSEEPTALFHTSLWAGLLFSSMGDPAQAIPLLEESIVYSRDMDRPWCEAVAAMLLGMALLQQDDSAQAYQHLHHAYRRLQRIGDPHVRAVCATALSKAAAAVETSGEMDALVYENLHRSRARGDRWSTAMWLTDLGVAALRQERLAAAEEHFTEAISLFQQLDERWGISQALLHLAETLAREGKAAEAEERFLSAIEQAQAAQALRTQVDAQLGLAVLWAAQGKMGAAEAFIAQALAQPNLTPGQLARIEEARRVRK